MSKCIELSGQRFGRLSVIRRHTENRFRQAAWVCVCECGKSVIVPGAALRGSHTRSCGCLQSDVTIKRNYRHGRHGTREHHAWIGMRARCQRPTTKSWADYGGRGITVCDRWQSFENFFSDMGPCPEGGSIERINNNGHYSPENCRWATRSEQALNTRRNNLLTLGNVSHPIAVWAKILGFKKSAIGQRLRYGWSVERALTTPLLRKRRHVTAP